MTETQINHGETASWKSRACPGVFVISGSWVSLKDHSARVVIRRMSMWTTLLLRTLISILMIAANTLGSRLLSVVVGIIILVLNVIFMTWCLAQIDRAQGYRHVLCLRVGRNHLDIFLVICAFLHVILTVGFWTFFSASGHLGSNIFWFALWALIAAYGFICTTSPDSAA